MALDLDPAPASDAELAREVRALAGRGQGLAAEISRVSALSDRALGVGDHLASEACGAQLLELSAALGVVRRELARLLVF